MVNFLNQNNQLSVILGFLKGFRTLKYNDIAFQFNIEINESESIINHLINEKILTANKNNDEIEIIEIKTPEEINHELTFDEFVILGYCILSKSGSIKKIASNLDYPSEMVSRTIFYNNYQGLITANFSIKLNKINKNKRRIFLKLADFNQIQLNLIKKAIFKKYQYFEILWIKIRKEDLETIKGLLLLKNSISFSTIMKDTNLIMNKEIKQAVLFRILSILAIENDIRINLTDEMLLNSEQKELMVPDYGELPSIINLPYTRPLLSIMNSEQSKELNKILKDLNLDKSRFPILLNTLSRMRISGLFVGKINGNLLICDNINNHLISSYSLLTREERLFYTIIKTEKSVNINYMAKELGRTEEYIKSLINDLNSSTEIEIEITQNDDIAIINLPLLPPLTRIQSLSVMHREILGYIKCMEKVTYTNLGILWELNPIRIKMILYELIGFGLIQLKIDNDTIELINIPNNYDIPSETKLRSKEILERTLHMRDPVNYADLAKKMNLDLNDMIKELSLLVADGFYDDGKFSEGKFWKNKFTRIKTGLICYNCGMKWDEIPEFCPNCECNNFICSICKGYIKTDIEIALCPNCKNPNHQSHIETWLKLKPECPMCQESLQIEKLLIVPSS